MGVPTTSNLSIKRFGLLPLASAQPKACPEVTNGCCDYLCRSSSDVVTPVAAQVLRLPLALWGVLCGRPSPALTAGD